MSINMNDEYAIMHPEINKMLRETYASFDSIINALCSTYVVRAALLVQSLTNPTYNSNMLS